MRTFTRIVSYERLSRMGRDGTIIAQLMMAFNDIDLVNEMLRDLSEGGHSDSRERRHAAPGRRQAARQYLLRLMISHFHEGLEALKSVGDSPGLMRALGQCGSDIARKFDELMALLETSKNKSVPITPPKVAVMVRNNVGFHYGEKMVRAALRDRMSRPQPRSPAITRGGASGPWRFDIADDLIESIVCRQIVAASADDPAAEMDAATGEIWRAMEIFQEVVTELIWKTLEK